METRQHVVQPLVELRVPFELSREAIDDVDRGSEDSNWQPVKTAVETLAAADEGYLSHDAETVKLYVQETVTFRVNTDEASVVITN